MSSLSYAARDCATHAAPLVAIAWWVVIAAAGYLWARAQYNRGSAR
jgi:hypothetical protein